MFRIFSRPKSSLSPLVAGSASLAGGIPVQPMHTPFVPVATAQNGLNNFGEKFTPYPSPMQSFMPKKVDTSNIPDGLPRLSGNIPLILQQGMESVDKHHASNEQNYAWLHHEVGQSVSKTIAILKTFLAPSVNEKPDDKDHFLHKDGEKSKETHNPYRALLEKNGFSLKLLDTILNNDETSFRNYDYGFAQLQRMSDLSKALKKIIDDKKSFEEYVHNAPEDMKKFIKEPLDTYLAASPKAISEALTIYEKSIKHPKMPFLERVLYDKYLNHALETSLQNLSALDIVKKEDFLKAHLLAISDPVGKFVKLSNEMLQHCSGDSFNQDQMMGYVSLMPDLLKKITFSLANAFGDERLKNHPEFAEKLASLLQAVHSIIDGPLGKDVEYWLSQEMQMRALKDIQENGNVPKMPEQKEKPASMQDIGLPKPQFPLAPKQEILPFMGNNHFPPQNLLHPLQPHEQIRPPVFDDSFPRRLQNYNEWSIYGKRLAERLKSANDIADTVQEIALTPSGRPDPEFIALHKRRKQLEWLKKLMEEASESNKATQAVEEQALKNREEYLKGAGQLMQDRMKLDTNEAQQKANMGLLAVKGATALAAKNMEAALHIAESREKMFNLFMDKIKHIYNNTWARIKSIADGFKWR